MSIPNLDTLSASQLCSVLQGLGGQELIYAIRAVRRRFGPQAVSMNISGVGPEVSPLGLGVRAEWTQLVRAGRAFGQSLNAPAVAAQFSYVQLFNSDTAVSGQSLLVFGVAVQNSDAAPVSILSVATFDPTELGTAASSGQNLKGGAALITSVGKVRASSNAAVQGNPFASRAILASTEVDLPVQGFVCELLPQTGMDIFGQTLNSAIRVSYLWAQVPTTYP
jgi:hypothetical protein